MRKVLIIAILMVGLAAYVAYVLNRHRCPILPNAVIIVDTDVVKTATLYQCRDDSLVVWFEGDNDQRVSGAYGIYTQDEKVAHVNDTNFIKFGSGLFSWNIPFDSVVLGEVLAKNDEIRPNLVIESGRIEFSPYAPHRETRIRISR